MKWYTAILVLLCHMGISVRADTPPAVPTYLLSSLSVVTPSSGKYKLYINSSDGLSYTVNSSGIEALVKASAIQLQGRAISATAPTEGQVLSWNNAASQWEPSSSGGSGANTTLSNLASPTSINQDLLSKTGEHHDIGSSANWFGTTYARAYHVVDSSGFDIGTMDNSSTIFQVLAVGGAQLTLSSAGGGVTVSETGGNDVTIQSSSGSVVTVSPNIKLQDGSQGNPGDVWTENDGEGTGRWAAAALSTPIKTDDGSAGAPGFSFIDETSTGLYRIGVFDLGISVGGELAMDCTATSPSGFVNCAMGSSASTSQQFPFGVSRTQDSSGVYMFAENLSEELNSKGCFLTRSNNGSASTEMCTYGPGTVAPINNTFRIHPSGVIGTWIEGGDQSTSTVNITTGGDPVSTGLAATFEADHSVTLYNLLKLPVQGSGVTPTCGTPQDGSIALTHAHILCVCNGSAWKDVATGLSSCTF